MNVYSTTYSNGHTDLTICPAVASNYINFDAAQVFCIGGKPVSPEFFFAEAEYCKAQEYPRNDDTFDGARRFHE